MKGVVGVMTNQTVEAIDEDDIEWDASWNDQDDDEPVDGGYPPETVDDLLSPEGLKTRGQNGGKQLLAKERTRRALELRKAGATYEAIAQALGYNGANGAWQAVKRGIEQGIQEPAAELRYIQYERLNNMLLVEWPKVQSGDENAIRTCLQIMDKMDRLMGTDAPIKTEVDVSIDGAIIVAEVDGDSYLRAMKAMVLQQQDHQEIGDIDHEPTGFLELDAGDIIDADVVEEVPMERKPSGTTKKASPKKQAAPAKKKPAGVRINTKEH